MLEIAQLAVGLAVVLQRRSPSFDRFGQHVADDGDQPCHPGARDSAPALLVSVWLISK